jgi:hypothetical protein
MNHPPESKIYKKLNVIIQKSLELYIDLLFVPQSLYDESRNELSTANSHVEKKKKTSGLMVHLF